MCVKHFVAAVVVGNASTFVHFNLAFILTIVTIFLFVSSNRSNCARLSPVVFPDSGAFDGPV